MTNKTKIIATLGPASNTRKVLKEMITAGMNVARLNFSHGDYETHGESIKLIRSLSRTMNRHVGILLDLQGPKIRTGKLKDGGPVYLETGESIRITTQVIKGTAEKISATYKGLTNDTKKGDTILLDDEALFDSGPCELTAQSWPRQFVHRPLAGRDNEVILDLGRRSRSLVQTGQLRASTALAISLQIDRIETLPGAQQYTLVDAFGQTYFPVLVETAGLTAPVTRGPSFTATYEILYRQLS